MASSADLLGTGVSGLLAFQRNLAVTGHNITNVNTEGYSRQTAELATRTPNISAQGFIGTGVDNTTVRRVYDQFVFDQVITRNSSYNQLSTLEDMSARIDDLLANDESGLDPMLQEFFNSIQGVANNPTSIPSRQVVLSNADSLANRFQALNDQFEELRYTINGQLEAVATEVTGLAASIAELNQGIVVQKGLSGGQPPNDLLDKRDVLLNRLSELISVRTVEAEDGSLNVFVGNGQNLVLGQESAEFVVSRNGFDLNEVQINYQSSTVNFPISDQLSGGVLGGLLQFREQVLTPAQNALGRIAIGLADTFNTQHAAGDDLAGNPGGLFFADIVNTSPEVLANTNNNPASGTVSVVIDNSSALKASDYRLTYDGANFTLIRTSDNTVVDSAFNVGDLPRTVAAEGFTIDLAGGIAAGDSFLIRPVRNGARDIALALSDSSLFAAAGNGNALGDNSNALAMVGLQSQKLMGNGSETYQTAYSKMVTTVGVQTSEARINASAQKTLLGRAVENMQSVSGVNLDEEAADLVKFQQAYQAAAQVITIANEVFQTLLNATAR